MSRARNLATLGNKNILTGISTSSRVGIGSTIPDTKLDVDGTITATLFSGDGSSLTGTGATDFINATQLRVIGVTTAVGGVNITGGELTVGSGITMGIAGVATFSGTSDVHLLDNVKLNVGDSNDFQVSHDGSDTILNNTTGALKILSDQTISFRDSGDSEAFAVFTDNGSVDLYYDNNKKFETHNTGVKVTGIATISSDLNVAGITTVGILTAYESITVKVGAGSTELTTALSAKASTGKAIAMAMVFG